MVNQPQTQEQERTGKNGRALIFVLWGLVALFLLGMFAYSQLSPKPDPCPGDLAIPGGEKLGGNFTAQYGDRTVTQDDVITGPSLIYFGYTFCPDVCPLDTARNAEITDILAQNGVDLTPIFITIDPERDTPDVMNEYTSYVHEDMIGLSGTQEQIDHLKSIFKVYAQKQPDADDPDFYLMDHSGYSYFVTPKGFVSAYSRSQSADEIASNIQCQLKHLAK